MASNGIDKRIFTWLKIARIRAIKKHLVSELAALYRDPYVILEKLHILNNANRYARDNIVFPNDSDINREIDEIVRYGATIVTYDMDTYPNLLKEINSAPILLTAVGNTALMNQKCITIVGSRVPAIISENFAHKMASDISSFGITTVSGLAKGIDTVVHKATVSNTIAVIGTGIDVCYPRQNKELATKIHESGGLIVTEFPLGTNPVPENFPQRNRIMAAIGSGVIVIEAKNTSGSMITAKYASNYNRSLYAVPGFPSDARYSGNNALIKNNLALLVESATDVYNDIEGTIGASDTICHNNITLDLCNDNANIDDMQDQIMSKMSSIPVSIDEIVISIDAPVNIVRAALLELELKSLIDRADDGKFYLVSSLF